VGFGNDGIFLKGPRELEFMERANRVVLTTLGELADKVAPGVTTADLDRHAEKRILELGAQPAFKGYRDFPCTLCASINHEVVHGIPSPKRVLKDGDILGMDLGAIVEGYYGDAAITVPVGDVTAEAQRLMDVTAESLRRGIAAARIGNRVSDIGHAVQTFVEENKLAVVRDFVGHGIGQSLHENPQVPNHGAPGRLERLKEGMVLAIEPMVTTGSWRVRVEADNWTAVTADGSLSAHFERSIAITAEGPTVLGADGGGF
jgi:methionyl aminopeptidase